MPKPKFRDLHPRLSEDAMTTRQRPQSTSLLTTKALRALCIGPKNLGCTVNWDNTAGTVVITDPDNDDETLLRALKKGRDDAWIVSFFNGHTIKWGPPEANPALPLVESPWKTLNSHTYGWICEDEPIEQTISLQRHFETGTMRLKVVRSSNVNVMQTLTLTGAVDEMSLTNIEGWSLAGAKVILQGGLNGFGCDLREVATALHLPFDVDGMSMITANDDHELETV